jgi:hypothetical protein
MHRQTATLFGLAALLFALGCNNSPEIYDFDGDGSHPVP